MQEVAGRERRVGRPSRLQAVLPAEEESLVLVEEVARHGMADRREVHADLVLPARDGKGAEERVPRQAAHDPELGQGGKAVGVPRRHLHPHSARLVPAQGELDAAFLFLHRTLHEGEVALGHGARLHEALQGKECFARARDQEHAACEHVQPVHQPGIEARIAAREVLADQPGVPLADELDGGPRLDAAHGVGGDSRGLVQREEPRVFEQDGQGRGGPPVERPPPQDGDLVAFAQSRRGGVAPAVQKRFARLHLLPEACAREAGQAQGEVDIRAKARRAPVRRQAVRGPRSRPAQGSLNSARSAARFLGFSIDEPSRV